MKALEQMLVYPEQVSKSRTVDIYVRGTAALLTPPLMVYDFPSIDTTMHIHGSLDGNTLYGGDIRPIGSNEPFQRINGYEAAMADYWLKNSGMEPKYPKY